MDKKRLKKVLTTACVVGVVLGTGSLSKADSLDNINKQSNSEVTEEKQYKDNKQTIQESKESKSKEEDKELNEGKQVLEENSEKGTENQDSEELELSSDVEKSNVKAENEVKSTRGLEELRKLDYKNFSKERQQFVEKLASAIDNIPYKGDVHELSKDPEYKKYYTQENPDSLTCSEFMSWGLYQSGHTEVGNHFVRDFYADTENFTHLSDKDTLMPGDFILDYTAGNRTGHILVYAGKDANGVEYLMHSQKYKGFNPNEKTLQNGPNIVKRSEYKVINRIPIYVRYNKFSDVEDKKDLSGISYADETNKNEIGKFQVDNIKITQAKDQNKESYFEDAYRFNISFSSKEKIKEGETLSLDGYYPKLHDNDKNEDYFYATFPYTSKLYDEKAKTDIKIKNGNNEVVIGQMVGNKITFNKNAENFDKVNFTVSLGVPSSNRLNVEPEGRQELYEVPFYLTINGKRLSKPYKQKIKPSDRNFINKQNQNIDVNYERIRLYEEPEEGKDIILKDVSVNPYKVFYDLAMNDTWKDAKVQVKMILPEGLEFKDNQTYKNNGISYYTNHKRIVLADNKNINRYYNWAKGITSIDSKVIDKKTGIVDFKINEKPLTDKKNSKYDWAVSGLDIKVTNRSLLDLENKKLKSPIKFEYYVNDKLVDTVNLDTFQPLFAVNSSSGGSVTSQTKEETKVEVIKFGKKTRETKDLEEGKTRVVQKGIDGEKTITYKVTYENGKETKREKVSEKITKQPVDEIVEVGTKKVIPAKNIEDIAVKTQEKDINYDIVYVAKADLDFEKTEVIQKGVKGKKKVVTKGSEKPVETVLEKPKTEIIGVGNKKVVEEDIKVEGKNAKKVTTTVYEVDKTTGKLINPKSTSKITLKAEEIEDISTKVTKKEEAIKFKTIYEADSTLEYGKTKTKVKGKDGKKEITTTTKAGKSKVSEKVVENSVNEVVLVGNKKVEVENIEENGLRGTKTTTTIYEVDKNTGKLVNPKVTVKKSLKAGVLEDNATTTKTTKEEIKGKTFYEADDSLEFGKQVVIKKTVDGEKEVTSKTVSGKTTKTEKILKEAEDGLVKVGNKKVEVETKDGITITTTTIYEVDKETGKLINPKVSKTTKMGTIEDIAKKAIAKADDKAKTVKPASSKLPKAGVETGVGGSVFALVGGMLTGIGLTLASSKKKRK